MLNVLIKYYDESKIDYLLPIKINELDLISRTLALQDGRNDGELGGQRALTDYASVQDMKHLYERLMQHFTSHGSPSDEIDLNMRETKALTDIFYSLEDYYQYDKIGKEHVNAYELMLLYDQLAEVFGEKSDFEYTWAETEELFDNLSSNEDGGFVKKFEGKEIDSLADFEDIQRDQNKWQLDQLMSELGDVEAMENENMESLEYEVDMQSQELDSILTGV